MESRDEAAPSHTTWKTLRVSHSSHSPCCQRKTGEENRKRRRSHFAELDVHNFARQVLLNRTRGYRHHPQLERFRALDRPVAAINTYLQAVHQEATVRSYRFNRAKIGAARLEISIVATTGQLSFEWSHLMAKLQRRNPKWLLSVEQTLQPEPHPLFCIVKGPVEEWERPPRGAP